MIFQIELFWEKNEKKKRLDIISTLDEILVRLDFRFVFSLYFEHTLTTNKEYFLSDIIFKLTIHGGHRVY